MNQLQNTIVSVGTGEKAKIIRVQEELETRLRKKVGLIVKEGRVIVIKFAKDFCNDGLPHKFGPISNLITVAIMINRCKLPVIKEKGMLVFTFQIRIFKSP
jgi:hypothetical protein